MRRAGTDLGSEPPRGSVRGSSFRLLWLGQAVSLIGDGAVLIALPILVLKISDSAVAAAAVVGTRTAAYLAVGPLAGPFLDRWDVKHVMVTADLLRAAGFGAILLLAAGGSVWLVVLIAFLASCAGVFFETALTIAVQDLLQPEELVAANARLEMTNQTGLLAAPALVGAALAVTDVRAFVALNAATFVISAASLWPLHFRRTAVADSHATPVRTVATDLRRGFTYIVRHPVLRRLVALQVVTNAVVSVETLLVYFVRHNLGASTAETGLMLSAAGLGGLGAAVCAERIGRRRTPEHLIGGAIALLAVVLAAFAVAATTWQVTVANGFLGLLSVFASIHIRALRQRLVPREMLGRVTANARTLAFAAYPLAALALSGLTEAAGGSARPAFAVAAGVSLASAGVAAAQLSRSGWPDGSRSSAG